MKSWEENLRFGARLHYNSINSVAKFWLSGLFPCFSSSLENSPLTSPLEDSNLDTPSPFWQQCGTSTFNPTSNFSWSGKRNNNQPNCFKQLQSFGQKKSKLENIRTHQTLLSLDEQRFQVFCQIKKMVFRNVGNLKWQSRGEYINRLYPISGTAWDFVLFPVLRVFLQIRCFLLSRCNRKWQLVLFAAIIRPTKVDCQVHKTVNVHFSYIPPPPKKNKIVNTTVPIFNLAARARCNILEFDLKRNHCTFVQYLTTERWNSVPIFRPLLLSNNAESRMFHCSKVCIGKSFPRENFCPNLMPSPSFEVYDIAADAHWKTLGNLGMIKVSNYLFVSMSCY